MKSRAELENIRKRTLESINIRTDSDKTRVVVGMGTCGIASGAREILLKFLNEKEKRHLDNLEIRQTGCIGVCKYEPMAEVYRKGEEKVTYVYLTPEIVEEIVTKHIVNGTVLNEYTIGTLNKV